MPDIPVVLITGASRGLGRGIAIEAAAEGCSVVINYASNAAAADEAVALCQQAARTPGQRFVPVKGDVSSREDRDAVLRQTLDAFGRIDALVNNAGIAPRIRADLTETSEASFEELLRINLQGPFFLTQALLPRLADGGRILNVSTGLARFTMPGYSAYASAKGAVEVLTRYMAKELGARGIRVNVVAPGAIESDFGGGVVRDNPDLNRTIAGTIPLGRVGLPDDIGRGVAAILSDGFGWANGTRIELSGGQNL